MFGLGSKFRYSGRTEKEVNQVSVHLYIVFFRSYKGKQLLTKGFPVQLYDMFSAIHVHQDVHGQNISASVCLWRVITGAPLAGPRSGV